MPKVPSPLDFRALRLPERRRLLGAMLGLDDATIDAALDGLDAETADKMVENAIGVLGVPFGVAQNVVVNGQRYIVPMAIEEPSVIAAASHAAKRVLAG